MDWPAVKALAMGHRVALPPRFVEIHVDNRCNLRCKYCRGDIRTLTAIKGVRDVSSAHLAPARVLQIVDELRELNPNVFVRISGIIGEPLFRESEILPVFDHLARSKVRWGLTTNGVKLVGQTVLESLMTADYVHISIDAGSEQTYHDLKGGKLGDYSRALGAVSRLQAQRGGGRTPQIVVSYLLQMENFNELESLAAVVRAAGADVLEIKMQHYDAARIMAEEAVLEALRSIKRISASLSSSSFRIVAVQDEVDAIAKVHQPSVPFHHCYAHELGLSTTVTATGEVQTCCQYYQSTLGALGSLKDGNTFPVIWRGARRNTILRSSEPSKVCDSCSPSDDFVNRFLHFLQTENSKDPTFLGWVEEEVVFG
jgi:MoaA/NifB/PqqE/SkfB family radical SAM enzyme